MAPEIQLIQGSCYDGLLDVNDKSIDLVLVDPPYGYTKNAWDERLNWDRIWPLLRRKCKPNAAIIIFSDGIHTVDLIQSNRKEWRYNIVWRKNKPSGFLNANKMPLRAHEDLCVFYSKLPVYNPQKTSGHKPMASRNTGATSNRGYGGFQSLEAATFGSTDRMPISVIDFDCVPTTKKAHHSQKPIALLQYLIKTFSNKGDVVLDFCAGSGSTGRAACEIERQCILIENHPPFCQKIREELDPILFKPRKKRL